MRSMVIAVVACLLSLPAHAQTSSRSHWGVTGGFTPSWQVLQAVGDLVDRTVDVTGNEFELGLIRGRDLGGDWGLSFVRKRVSDGSTVTNASGECYSLGTVSTCAPGVIYATRGTTIDGVEAHKYIPFVTIKRRVQLGMNLAAGVGRVAGRVEKTESALVVNYDTDSRRFVASFTPRSSMTTPDELLEGYDIVPLARVELAAALVVTPGLKVRASGGFTMPGVRAFGLTATYLFGAR